MGRSLVPVDLSALVEPFSLSSVPEPEFCKGEHREAGKIFWLLAKEFGGGCAGSLDIPARQKRQVGMVVSHFKNQRISREEFVHQLEGLGGRCVRRDHSNQPGKIPGCRHLAIHQQLERLPRAIRAPGFRRLGSDLANRIRGGKRQIPADRLPAGIDRFPIPELPGNPGQEKLTDRLVKRRSLRGIEERS